MLNTVPMILPSAYVLPAMSSDEAKTIGSFAFIFSIAFYFLSAKLPDSRCKPFTNNTGAIQLKEKLPYISLLFRLFAAFGTNTFDHVVDGMWSEPIGNIYHRYTCRFNAICFLTMFAIEVSVLVGDAVFISTVT